MPATNVTAKTDISKCLPLLFGTLKLCIFIVLCLLQPTANYDLAIIEDYLAGNAKIKILIKNKMASLSYSASLGNCC